MVVTLKYARGRGVSLLTHQLKINRGLASIDTPPFRLDPKFVEQYADLQPPFGFNGLGELVYLRTYAR